MWYLLRFLVYIAARFYTMVDFFVSRLFGDASAIAERTLDKYFEYQNLYEYLGQLRADK